MVKHPLAGLDACTVSDALDSLDLPGAVAGVPPTWEGARTVGRVITMKVVASAGARAERHLGARAIEQAGVGDVIVIEQSPSQVVSATWGGLLAKSATLCRLAGVVIDGNCRDVDEIRELGLPVFARGVVPFTARRRYVEESVGSPVSIGGVAVETGDHVVADGSGIAFVRARDLDAVAARSQEIVRREALMMSDLESGATPAEVMGRNYEELLDD
jgi:regulator of RNase E activity RraA